MKREPTHTYIPLDIQCFWCNGEAKRGTASTSPYINSVTYFCKNCGSVAHFAVNHKQKICAIEVDYKSSERGEQDE